jgi:hypothetical protein
VAERSDGILSGLIVFVHERLGLSPNQISTIGFVAGILAAVLVLVGYLEVGLVGMAVSQVIDGLDGGVARRYGLVSAKGKMLEIIFDRLNELAIFLALAIVGLVSYRMVVLAVVAILLVAAIAVWWPRSTPGPSPSGIPTPIAGNTFTYQNPTVGVQFSYPQSWVVSNNPTRAGADRYYAIWPPVVGSTDTRVIGFWNHSLDDYSGALDKITYNYNSTLIDSNYTNVILIDNFTPTTLGGLPAYVASWSFTYKNSPQTTVYDHEIWTVKNGRLYGIKYTSRANLYSASLPDVDQIFSSFKFI